MNKDNKEFETGYSIKKDDNKYEKVNLENIRDGDCIVCLRDEDKKVNLGIQPASFIDTSKIGERFDMPDGVKFDGFEDEPIEKIEGTIIGEEFLNYFRNSIEDSKKELINILNKILIDTYGYNNYDNDYNMAFVKMYCNMYIYNNNKNNKNNNFIEDFERKCKQANKIVDIKGTSMFIEFLLSEDRECIICLLSFYNSQNGLSCSQSFIVPIDLISTEIKRYMNCTKEMITIPKSLFMKNKEKIQPTIEELIERFTVAKEEIATLNNLNLDSLRKLLEDSFFYPYNLKR